MKILSFTLLFGLIALPASAQYSLTPAFPNLAPFTQPLEFQMKDDDSNKIYIVEQKGKIYSFENTPSSSVRKVFLDLSNIVSQTGPGSETGLLGLAFHPHFSNFGTLYVNYTTGTSPNIISHISRFQVDPLSDTVVNNTEQVILTLVQPSYPNHKGGHLVFGLDGYLYAAFGDGGSGGDPQNRAQNRDSLFGKILRLDVDHEANAKHYAIPPDNPYANNTQGFRQEIYAYGLRNVWKFSFDHLTGRLWAGDVGQALYEEIDTIQNGGNYGWNHMEGFHCYPSGNFNCDSTGFIPPLWEYPHYASNGSVNGDEAIDGGFVYRGSAIPSLVGKYIYGDYNSDRIWALDYEGKSPATNQLLIDKGAMLDNCSGFGEDQKHELYVIGYSDGKIYRLVSSEQGGVQDSKSGQLMLGASQPNPFSQFIVLTYSIPEYGMVTLALYDELGREVAQITNKFEAPDIYTFNFDGSKLPAGSYILRLGMAGKVISKKIIKE